MPNDLVVAVQVFHPNDLRGETPMESANTSLKCANTSCGAENMGRLSPHFCELCRSPQPIQEKEEFFSAFGLERRFAVDIQGLEVKFYELSRVLHPDRFSAGGGAQAKNSLERMGFLNQAYSTLKNKGNRRDYLLKIEGIELPKENQGNSLIPIDLAEAWFDLQDELIENPAESKTKIVKFNQLLEERFLQQEDKIMMLEKTFDQSRIKSTLETIAKEIRVQNYIQSLQAQVEKRSQAP